MYLKSESDPIARIPPKRGLEIHRSVRMLMEPIEKSRAIE